MARHYFNKAAKGHFVYTHYVSKANTHYSRYWFTSVPSSADSRRDDDGKGDPLWSPHKDDRLLPAQRVKNKIKSAADKEAADIETIEKRIAEAAAAASAPQEKQPAAETPKAEYPAPLPPPAPPIRFLRY